MGENQKVFTSSIKYLFNLIIALVSNFLRGILTAKLLSPYYYGVFQFFELIRNYVPYTWLGIDNIVMREIPRSDEERQRRIINTMFTFKIFPTIFAFIILLIYYRTNGLYSLYFKIYLIICLLYGIKQSYDMLLKINKQFSLAGKTQSYSAILFLMLTVFLGYCYRLKGVVIALLSSLVFNYIYVVIKYKFHPRFYINFKLLKYLLIYGIPIFIIPLCNITINKIDKFFVIKYFSMEQFGLYSLGVTLSNYIIALPSYLTHITTTYIFHESAKENQNYMKFIFGPTHIIVYITALLVSIVYFTSIILVKYFLKDYLSALPTIKILLWFAPFYSILSISTLVLYSKNIEYKTAFIAVCFLILSGLFNALVVYLDFGVIGIAVATVLTYLLYSVFLNFYLLRLLKAPLAKYILFIEVGIIYLYFLSSTVLLEKISFLNVFELMIFNDILNSLIKIIIIFIISLSFIWYIDRYFPLIENIKLNVKKILPKRFFS